MPMWKDSFEYTETLSLIAGLLDSGGPRQPVSPGLAVSLPVHMPPVSEDAFPVADGGTPSVVSPAGSAVSLPPTPPPRTPDLPEDGGFLYRGDHLETILRAMCSRGGFHGAVVADEGGLPLAVHNSPVDPESLAAFTSVLGGALERAGRFLSHHGADFITMDIDLSDKVALKQFSGADRTFYLMVLCPQSANERSEMEVSIQQVQAALVAPRTVQS